MPSPAAPTYAVLDSDLPDRPPLAGTDDYDTALRQVDRLHADFHAQLTANGEGASQLTQRLRIVQHHPDRAAEVCFLSTVSGFC